MQYTGKELVQLATVFTTLHGTHVKLTLSQVEQVLRDTIDDEELRKRLWGQLRGVLLDALNSHHRSVKKLLQIQYEQ